MLKSLGIIPLCKHWGIDILNYKDLVLKIGDVTAIRMDKEGVPFRRNFERALLLIAVALKYRPKNVLEFGTGRGFATACLSTLDFVEHITTVDKLNSKDTERLLVGLDGVKINKIKFIKADSKHLQDDQLEKVYDLVFIDGEHTAEAVRNDLSIANRHTHEKSVIVFDDYRQKHAGVKKYISSLTLPRILVYTDGWVYENRLLKKHGDADQVVDGKEFGSGQVIMYKDTNVEF